MRNVIETQDDGNNPSGGERLWCTIVPNGSGDLELIPSPDLSESEKQEVIAAFAQEQSKFRAREDALAVQISKGQHPKVAEYLLYLFLSKNNRDAILGDMNEDYTDVLEKFGTSKAVAWYWMQVVSLLIAALWKIAVQAFEFYRGFAK